jgi:glutamyl-tRNA reductase
MRPERLEIILMGLNHKTAPVALRECIAMSTGQVEEALQILKADPCIRECVVVSTCNRVELIMTAEEGDAAVVAGKRFITDFNALPSARFEQALYVHRGDDAVRHLFRVASSLDSMMVGEPQILGQIKTAYRLASRASSSGVILNRLLHRTFFVAKRVRSETGIGDHAVSISYAAIELARKIFGTIENCRVLLVGAGEMAELAVEHLKRNRVSDIRVANRTFERGVALARRFDGRVIRFEELTSTVADVDIVISSTGARGFVLNRTDIKPAMRRRKNRPIFFIDIAVPRDIDPEINRISNAYVYDIDDLKGVIQDNLEDRQRESVKAERIVDEAVFHFREWYVNLDLVPTIKALHRKVAAIVATEFDKSFGGADLSEKKRKAIRAMADSIGNKILHHPTLFLKGEGCHGDKAVYLDMTRKMFKLDEE